MAGMRMSTAAMILTVAVLVASGLTEAQDSGTQTCAQKLVPCAAFMNSTSPPASCCDPIKEAVATDLQCLCDLYNTPGLLDSLGFSVPQALNLTRNCGVDPNTSSCNVGAPSPTSAVPPPPGVAGNGAGSLMAWTGVSTLLLSAASVMLC